MLIVLRGRDGTRIWTFIFSVTTHSQETMYCISFLHFNLNSQSLIEEVCITFMIRQKILVKEKLWEAQRRWHPRLWSIWDDEFRLREYRKGEMVVEMASEVKER